MMKPRDCVPAVILLAAAAAACTPKAPHREIPPMTLPVEAVSLDPRGLASTVGGRLEPAEEHEPDRPPFMNGVPGHLRFAFDSDRLSPQVVYRERQLLVYPLEAYRQIQEGHERTQFDRQVGALQSLIASKGAGSTKDLLVLPPVAAGQVFASRVAHKAFSGGEGIRWITRYSVVNTPTTNSDIFYTFQGITADGKYYVSLFWPVEAKGLPETRDFQASRRFLDGLPDSDFTPGLADLDALVRSITIKGN